ncbi:MAG TPA: tyrosine-type recombinase/integrase [Lacipirellulaceae bacterium]|nr:tyrosine-type recombinase/integrase [Lacipirellulaceae bacterium]
MASIFKLRFNHYFDKAGKRVPKGTPGAKSKRYTSEKWYGKYRDEFGLPKRVPLDEDEDRSRELLADLELKAARARRGLTDPAVRFAETPIADHLAEYRRHLEHKGNAREHVVDTERYVKRMAAARGFAFLRDVTPEGVRAFMLNLRALGRADRTANAYLVAMKAFLTWCVREGRAPSNPIAYLPKLNNHEPSRRNRNRALSLQELARLIDVAEKSEKDWSGVSGPDRAMRYAMALGTGFRAHELSSLTLASLNLAGDVPTATVEAAYSKRRKRDQQPLPAWLVDRLRPWLAAHPTLATAPQSAKLFPGGWWRRAAAMLREDLAAAEIDYVDEDGRVLDFHGLRHQYITALTAAGVHPKTAQTLARHSTIDLTMNLYTHQLRTDVADALATVPGPAPAPDSQRQRATGTHGRVEPNVCATRAENRGTNVPNGKLGNFPRGRQKRSQTLAGPRLERSGPGENDDDRPRVKSDSKSGAPKGVVGSNPMPSAVE